MNLFGVLILAYPAKRTAWLLLKKKFPDNWCEELVDFASFCLRTKLLQLLHYNVGFFYHLNEIPELSLTDVMSLSYPLHRLIDVFIRKRRKYPWKAEVKALIFSSICYFSIEVFVSQVLLDWAIMKPLFWILYIELALMLIKLFPLLPLQIFDTLDEHFVLPLCASVANYFTQIVAHGGVVCYLLSIFVMFVISISQLIEDD
ncbi:hypothetical protein DdX_14124 [Ditylenchus destructor]|uniref:Uncharacterized protein n=1 Tax=Ditylenchus destructor TaxID=166010 RepID=A0AAD4MXF1_9BILA|nr:hypothetical protein DdX_14124 [Ditylenchus destructor]